MAWLCGTHLSSLLHRSQSCLLTLRDPTPQPAQIRIGDVGFVYLGGFRTLFNITDSLGERTLGKDVPKDFQPLPEYGKPMQKLRKPEPLISAEAQVTSAQGDISFDKM